LLRFFLLDASQRFGHFLVLSALAIGILLLCSAAALALLLYPLFPSLVHISLPPRRRFRLQCC